MGKAALPVAVPISTGPISPLALGMAAPALTSTMLGVGRAVTKTRQRKARGRFAERIWHSKAVSKALGSSHELPPAARAHTTCESLEEHTQVY